MFTQQYPPGQYAPEMFPSRENHYSVWCENGAAEVLSNKVANFFASNQEKNSFFINFAGMSFADLPQHTILQESMENLLQQDFSFEVFAGLVTPRWQPWDKTNKENLRIDGIMVYRNKEARNTAIAESLSNKQQKLKLYHNKLLELKLNDGDEIISELDVLMTRYSDNIQMLSFKDNRYFQLYSKWSADASSTYDKAQKVINANLPPPTIRNSDSWISKFFSFFKS
jgi:hypothetical protein